MNPKWTLLLYGALMLLGAVCGNSAEHPSISDAQKRKILRNMLEAQKDIHKALLKIRRQIEGDHSSTDHHPEGSHEEGFTEEFHSEEAEHYIKEQQKKIREAREELEKRVKQIGSSLVAIKKYIDKIEDKVEHAIHEWREKKYTANYLFNHHKPHVPPHHGSSEESAQQHGFGFAYAVPDIKHVIKNNLLSPVENPKKAVKSGWNYRKDRSLLDTSPTDQLSSPDIPSVVELDSEPIQNTAEVPLNQQEIDQ